MKDEEEQDEEEEERELRRLREIATLASIYYRNERKFQRNPNLSHIVHAVMNLAQFFCVLINELFHHIHHAINRRMRAKDPAIPNIPDERSAIFIAYPTCLIISLVLGVLWLRFRSFERILETTLVGCAIGTLLMVLSAVLSMRQAEIHINLEEVSDDELLTHPIFIHNFIMCIISILAMVIYLLHFWIIFECWLSRKKARARDDSTSSSESEEDASSNPEPSTSRKSESAKTPNSNSVLTLEALKNKMLSPDEVSQEAEPVILYCCCVDCWQYLKGRESRTPQNEFQVVRVQ